TTSPSPSNWWLTLMPVISSNAFVSVLDSYSWVGMVSESTLISMPLKGVAASINHCISFSCSSFESTEGWNSLSIHFFASSTPPKAGAVKKTATATAMTDAGSVRVCIVSSIVFARGSPRFVDRTRDFTLRTHAMLETKRKSIESQAKANLRRTLHSIPTPMQPLAPRQQEILRLARELGQVEVDDLSARFEVSPQTIRKDLNELCDAGVLQRFHGGAMAPSGIANVAYEARRQLATEAKRRIGARTAALIPDGSS